MLGSRFEIFRIFGIPIRIDLSWLVVVALVAGRPRLSSKG